MEHCAIKEDLKYCILFDSSPRNLLNPNSIGMAYNLSCPVSVKDGLCPRASPYGPCVTTCGADEDCDGSKKCCSNGCGSWCLEPSKNIVIVGVVFLNGSQFVVIQTSLKSSMICSVYGHCYERRRHLFHGNAY